MTLILFLLLPELQAQENKLIDTSYSTVAAFRKIKKDYPELTIVGELSDFNIKSEKDIIYSEGSGNKLELDAFYRNSNEVLPAILLIHGGGWSSGSRQMLNPMAQRLALKGYQCFSVSYRLSGLAKYPAAIVDIENALKFLKTNAEHFHLDTNKIAILGCSAGAQIASLTGLRNSPGVDNKSGVSAIINVDGLMDFLDKDAQEGASAAKWLGGSETEIRLTWSEASPVNYIDRHAPPILFIHGNQKRFQAGRISAIQKLNKAGVYSETVFIDAPHTFWLFEPWQEEVIHSVDQFLERVF